MKWGPPADARQRFNLERPKGRRQATPSTKPNHQENDLITKTTVEGVAGERMSGERSVGSDGKVLFPCLCLEIDQALLFTNRSPAIYDWL